MVIEGFIAVRKLLVGDGKGEGESSRSLWVGGYSVFV